VKEGGSGLWKLLCLSPCTVENIDLTRGIGGLMAEGRAIGDESGAQSWRIVGLRGTTQDRSLAGPEGCRRGICSHRLQKVPAYAGTLKIGGG